MPMPMIPVKKVPTRTARTKRRFSESSGPARREIQRPSHPRRPPHLQRTAGVAVQDAIAVDAPERREPRVEPVRHRVRPAHADIVGQVRIDAEQPAARPAGNGSVEMNHLSTGMDARIGATTADQVERTVGDLGNGAPELRGHGALATLLLPARECGAVVFDTERDALHRGAALSRPGRPPAANPPLRSFSPEGIRAGGSLPASATPSLPKAPRAGCCARRPDRPCPCRPGPGRAWYRLR